MDKQIEQLASVLAALPETARLELAAHLIPATHALVPRRSNRRIEEAFKTAADRVHRTLKGTYSYSALIIAPAWEAMVACGAIS